MDFGVTWMYIIITNPSYSTGSHNVIIVLVSFLLIFVFILICWTEIEAVMACFRIFIDDDDDDDDDDEVSARCRLQCFDVCYHWGLWDRSAY